MQPLFHDLSGQWVLVFGGGPVGARKARRFAREADVLVISPAFSDEDFGDAHQVRAAPDPTEVAVWFERTEPTLAVAATDDPALNAAIAETARTRSVLINRTDTHGSPGPNGVVTPATVRDDPVVVAIATGGTSPALSRELRRRLESELAGAGKMAELTGDLRESLQDRDLSTSQRHAAIRAVVRSQAVWTALRTGDSNPRNEAERVIEETLQGADSR
ncbi:MAG: bifunctional precorrin-2 dehydrogenase/sirohydrochlorin ferrochelatase [Halobacteriales archaeon]|nr:bifunctional precorrin-2 dehydrogenase/sirohydrochlorin ferrochelatase [Halobacteriales archaeon]